jgi:Uma2 family endonuclease
MSVLELSQATHEKLAFTQQHLAYLPKEFPVSVIRDGRIARADGLPLGLNEYDLLGEDFPAILTETGELAMSPRPGPDHEDAREHLVQLLNHYLRCHPGGKISSGTELRIPQRDRPLAPDIMFFSKPERWPKSHINQLPNLAVEIISPSNTDAEWEGKLDFYQRGFIAEVWFNQLDGGVEIWKGDPHSSTIVQPAKLFSSRLFPGLAIDPVWIKSYPAEIERIEQFSPRIIVSPSVVNPRLTKKAHALAARIAQHFGHTYHPETKYG